MTIQEIIKKTIDLHLHIGPEIVPRKFNNVTELVESQKNKIAGFALKNHFYMTSPFIEEYNEKTSLTLIGGVVLNNCVGGINPEAVYAAAVISRRPIIVWFPTTDAHQFLSKSDYQIAPEWVQDKKFSARRSTMVKPITVLSKKNKLTQETLDTLKMIKKMRSILATGHLSWQESYMLCNEAIGMGISNIIITHPIYQKISMPVKVQKNLSLKGCFIEICYSMYSIDGISIQTIAEQIKAVGYAKIILSSDVGQKFSADPDIALYDFAQRLNRCGITENMLYRMMVTNPRIVAGLE